MCLPARHAARHRQETLRPQRADPAVCNVHRDPRRRSAAAEPLHHSHDQPPDAGGSAGRAGLRHCGGPALLERRPAEGDQEFGAGNGSHRNDPRYGHLEFDGIRRGLDLAAVVRVDRDGDQQPDTGL
uniref:(northern house mosquito) hypothetical protein n=1 Tax=Culex pipiens TaxID=7175 RepID=A0A8D8AS38_CULPI